MMAAVSPRKVSVVSRSRSFSDTSTASLDDDSSCPSNVSTPSMRFTDEPMRIELPGYNLLHSDDVKQDVKAKNAAPAPRLPCFDDASCELFQMCIQQEEGLDQEVKTSRNIRTPLEQGLDDAHFQKYLQSENHRLEQENARLLMHFSNCIQMAQQGMLAGPPGLDQAPCMLPPQCILPSWVPAQCATPTLAPTARGGLSEQKQRAFSDVSTAAGSETLSEGDSSDSGGSKTSAMLRNIPNCYTRQLLLRLLDSEGFSGKYDFVYLPIDFKTQLSLGYCFLNFVSTEAAIHFLQHFQGFNKWAVPSHKVARLNWCDSQGLKTHINRYKNSSIMQDNVLDEYKPALFFNGNRIPFPVAATETSGRKGSKGKATRTKSK